jgi:hypothetical protein
MVTVSLVDGAYSPDHPCKHQPYPSTTASSFLPNGSGRSPCGATPPSSEEWCNLEGQFWEDFGNTHSVVFATGASSSAPPIPVAQAPAPGGDDPDDFGDDEGEDENNDNIEDANNEQEDNFVGLRPVVEHYTSMFETGHFPNLLQDVLHALGTYVRPLYDTRRVFEPPRSAMLLRELCGPSATPISNNCTTRCTCTFPYVFVVKAWQVWFHVKLEKIPSTPL